MKWDYTNASKTYNKRPQYNQRTIDRIIFLTKLTQNNTVCDIGAGTGYLSIKLAQKGLNVTAIEPNQSMRDIGKDYSKNEPLIRWYDAQAESTKQTANYFDMVSFGSSFNVVDRNLALKEAQRIVKSRGYFCALWNHRDLNNPLQSEIENCISSHLPSYSYGLRRENQGEFLSKSNYFSFIKEFSDSFSVSQEKDDVVNAWKSHQTLIKQAGNKFNKIIDEIKSIVFSQKSNTIITPYSTRCWVAQFKD